MAPDTVLGRWPSKLTTNRGDGMSSDYEFHSPELGWVPAEEMPADNQNGLMTPKREGTQNLVARLPSGRIVSRVNVAHENHACLINIANGRCRLCNRKDGDLKFGRIYRTRVRTMPAVMETEPAKPLEEPRIPESAEVDRAALERAAPRHVASARR